MTLAGMRPGDIVQVTGGTLAYVRARERGRLLVGWVGRSTNERWVKAREVEAHWRKAKQPQ